MNYRQHTPPSLIEEGDYSVQVAHNSASSNGTFYPFDWSPESVMTAATSPEISTGIHSRRTSTTIPSGPMLLPRVRVQDQTLEPATALFGHRRHDSVTSTGFPADFGPSLRPGFSRRSTSPQGYSHMASPASAPSPYDPSLSMDIDADALRRPSFAHGRSSSTSAIRGHSRSGSSSSIDVAVLRSRGYPTYRTAPGTVAGIPMSRTPSAMSHLAPISMPDSQMQSMSYPTHRRTVSPPAPPSRLSLELEYDPTTESLETGKMLDYLTAPNPTPSLVQRTTDVSRGQSHCWFDIRNVRSWSDFNVSTFAAVPDLLELLKVPVSVDALPTPARVNLSPETHGQLHDLCATHYAVKLNAALNITQPRPMIMRSLRSTPGLRTQPEFVSSYQSDAESTGRVVGIVKCFDQWNSGMRSEAMPQRVKYLQGLSELHRFMRDHSCRYGFIMTEIEIVCVRYGGPPSDGSNVPLFGFMELAAPIQLSAAGQSGDKIQMTAGLALWFLHMLAKESPLPGQYGGRLDIGAPGARTRQNHLAARDDWMPKPHQKETREAKLTRGWVWPDEPLSRRERGRSRRTRA